MNNRGARRKHKAATVLLASGWSVEDISLVLSRSKKWVCEGLGLDGDFIKAMKALKSGNVKLSKVGKQLKDINIGSLSGAGEKGVLR